MQDEEGNPATSFIVVQAKKIGGNYLACICYVSPQAEELLESNKLIGQDISALIPNKNFREKHSILMNNFFKTYAETGVNPSQFISKHIARTLETLLLGDKTIKLDFTLDHTLKITDKKPIVYVVAHLNKHNKLQNIISV
jgi:uncharacterized protein (DUF2237 family)